MTLGIGGLASGLDTAALIDQMMQLERRPRVRMALAETVERARQDTLRDIGTRLRSLLAAAKDLSSPGVWADTQTVDVADATKVAARRVGATAIGGHSVNVTALARAEQRSYSFTAGAGTLDVAGEQFALTAADDGAAVASAINARSTCAFSAIFLPPPAGGGPGTLVLTRRQTGASPPPATVTGPQLSGETIKAGADASVTVDGTAYTSSSNVVTTALPGLELTLKDLGATTVAVSAPAPDPAAVKAKLQAFVDQYDETVDLIRGKVSEKRVVDATTTTDAKKGVLFADTQLTGLLSSLRSIVAGAVDVGGAVKSLADLGISTGAGSGGASSADALAGKLTIDDAKLSEAIADRRTDVRAFLGHATEGLAARLTAALDPVAKVGGLMDSRAEESGRELKRIGDALVRIDARLDARQASLQAQYVALESALAQAQQQASWLSGQLAALGT